MEPATIHPQSPIVGDLPEGAVPLIREYVGIRPGYCGGKPHILGHRIKVKHVAVWHVRMGMCPAEIVDHHPTITLVEAHAVLANDDDRREEIEADLHEGRCVSRGARAGRPTGVEKARRRNLRETL